MKRFILLALFLFGTHLNAEVVRYSDDGHQVDCDENGCYYTHDTDYTPDEEERMYRDMTDSDYPSHRDDVFMDQFIHH